MASVICTSPLLPFFWFLRLLNIFFGKIYLPITALFDGALLTDGLRSEREQGITIDVAYRYFATPKRKFIIASILMILLTQFMDCLELYLIEKI